MLAASKVDILKDRAAILRRSREFFHQRSILEVDTPLLSPLASVDEHIDLISLEPEQGHTSYLVSSPEYAMKRLLAEGIGDCYQLSHVFRKGESGANHRPEFTLTEWYRLAVSFDAMIRETLDYMELFVGKKPVEEITYLEAFQKYLQIDLRQESYETLKKRVDERLVENINDCLELLVSQEIEPRFRPECFTVLTHYPATQAALANTLRLDNYEVALRFEIYHGGLELCNGYDELIDAAEQKRRLEEANRQRISRGKEPLPIDTDFLEALEKGVPACCGVAVGFDRLMMLRHQSEEIGKILPY